MKTKLIIIVVLLFLAACGSKKSVSQSQTKEKTDIELTDNSKINTKVEQEQQYINTNTRERIVTLYGLRVDTIYRDGNPYPVYTSYPLQKEENRDIEVEKYIWRLNVQDSIQKAVELKYKSQVDEKDKKISEYKQSTIIYQIAVLLFVVLLIFLLVVYVRAKQKTKRLL